MFQSLGVPALLAIFVASAAVIWVAGVKLSNATFGQATSPQPASNPL